MYIVVLLVAKQQICAYFYRASSAKTFKQTSRTSNDTRKPEEGNKNVCGNAAAKSTRGGQVYYSVKSEGLSAKKGRISVFGRLSVFAGSS